MAVAIGTPPNSSPARTSVPAGTSCSIALCHAAKQHWIGLKPIFVEVFRRRLTRTQPKGPPKARNRIDVDPQRIFAHDWLIFGDWHNLGLPAIRVECDGHVDLGACLRRGQKMPSRGAVVARSRGAETITTGSPGRAAMAQVTADQT
jgi:hypothetical protein